MSQWLFVSKLVRAEMLISGPTAEESAAVGLHFSYWKLLTEEGKALVVGRTQTTDPDTMGLAIFLAEDEFEALRIGEDDPAVKAGVFRMQIFPYYVALLGEPDPFRP